MSKYGAQFETATEDEVRRLLDLADEGLIVAWGWLIVWVTGNGHPTIQDPREPAPGPATPDRVLAYFEDSAARQRRKHAAA